MLRLLTYTTLYPASARPSHGIFVETRLRHLVASGEVTSRVIAPVPWFPFRHACFGEYSRYARVPRNDRRHGIDIVYPRYPHIPKIGMTVAPFALAAATLASVRGVLADGYDFDAIDAHYFYPDGVAAAMIADRVGKPFVITARGTDINLIPRHRAARRMIRWAADRAAAIITVCAALKDALIELGVAPDKITPLRNGVDLERFRPVDRDEARTRLGLSGPVLISVGHLIERKGHHLVIEALKSLPDFRLLLVGQGPEEAQLRALAERLDVGARVRFVGSVPQEQLRDYYGAADALVLASSREGWANVLLEAMACGTPVVATPVWGTPEVVATPAAGVLTTRRDAAAIVDAIRRLFQNPPDRESTRRYAESFSWDTTTRGQIELFRRVVNGTAKT
jgi:glycosyltransferase involved in cell wall biosynthesis